MAEQQVVGVHGLITLAQRITFLRGHDTGESVHARECGIFLCCFFGERGCYLRIASPCSPWRTQTVGGTNRKNGLCAVKAPLLACIAHAVPLL